MLLITGPFASTKCNKTMLPPMQQLRSHPKQLGTSALVSESSESLTGLQVKLT